MGHQDILDDEFKQKDVWVIEDRDLLEFFEDSSYNPVLTALRKGPMTVKEITEKYNEIVKKKAIKLDIPKDAFEKMKRSEKTIYRYIKDLTERELVVVAGQRLIIGKTATENLYCRAAKVFLLNRPDEKCCEDEDSEAVLERAAKIFLKVEKIKDIDIKCLSKTLNEIYEKSNRYIFNALSEHFEEVSNLLISGSVEEGQKLLKYLNMISLVFNEENRNKLMKCIKQ